MHLCKDDSDYLAFKETTWSYSKFVYRSAFLCEPVPPLSAHSNLLYDHNKYANGTTICAPKTSNEKVAESLNFQMAANLKKIFCTKEMIN